MYLFYLDKIVYGLLLPSGRSQPKFDVKLSGQIKLWDVVTGQQITTRLQSVLVPIPNF